MRYLSRSASPRTLNRAASLLLAAVLLVAASSPALAAETTALPSLSRGPYLQLLTSDGVTIRWRTSVGTDTRLLYGRTAGSLTSTIRDDAFATEHSVTVRGLEPATRYYYSVATSTDVLAGDESYSFETAPEPGSAGPYRVWILGDSGTGGSGARAVRDAYYRYASFAAPDVWLMLGDNAYDSGTDAEYQRAVFAMYPEMLRRTALWSTIGNHETAQLTTASPDMAYFQIFTLPTRGEAGGVASGTEQYYSFDYGDIHFVCLDSMTSSRSESGPMMQWLRRDLASTSQPWIIAFWHHPPYSKGSHDSDTSLPLLEMRQSALPILEAAGVDLVLSGHSHSYERSYLLDGHYGSSQTLSQAMVVDGRSGGAVGGVPYTKPSPIGGSHEGAVYTVAGSSATTGEGPLNHPAMFVSLRELGSVILDVNGKRLDAKFLGSDGTVRDSFSIVKGGALPLSPLAVRVTRTSGTVAEVRWTDASSDEEGFRIQRCAGPSCTSFVEVGRTGANVTTFQDTSVPAGFWSYRVVAVNGAGVSPASAAAELKPPGAPRRRSVR